MTKLLIVSEQNELSVAKNLEGISPKAEIAYKAMIENAKRVEILFDDDEQSAFYSLICKVFDDTEAGVDVSLRNINVDATHSSFTLTLEQIKSMLEFIDSIKNARLDLIGCYGKIADAAWWFVDRGIFASPYTPECERFYLPESATPSDAVEFMKNTAKEIIKTAHIESPDYYKLERIYFEKLIPNPTEKDIRDDTKCSLLMRHRESRQAYAFEYKKMFYLFSNNLA